MTQQSHEDRKNKLFAAERAAYHKLLGARKDELEASQLETAIFNAWKAASKVATAARRREEAAFDLWYTESKALDGEKRANAIPTVSP